MCVCVYLCVCVCVCLCVFVCDRVKKHKTIWFVRKSLPPPIFFVCFVCLSSFYFPLYLGNFLPLFAVFSSVTHCTMHRVLHVAFHNPCSSSHSTLHLKLRSASHVALCVSLHAASHYILHLTLHAASHHSIFHLIHFFIT